MPTEDNSPPNEGVTSSRDDVDTIHPYITLPYKVSKGLAVIKSFKKCLSEKLQENNMILRFIFEGKILGHLFLLRTKSVLSICLGLFMVLTFQLWKTMFSTLVAETKVRHETRTYQHAYTDKNLAVHWHSHKQNYAVDPSNFTILSKGYPI